MKVKIFSFQDSGKIESAINEWLKNNPTAKIKFITHGEIGKGVYYLFTISIWYEK